MHVLTYLLIIRAGSGSRGLLSVLLEQSEQLRVLSAPWFAELLLRLSLAGLALLGSAIFEFFIIYKDNDLIYWHP
jgi:hypothetical protein